IAREAAAEMVVDAALAHARERELDRAEIAPVVQPLAGAPQEFEHHRLREFRRAAHAAMNGIDHARDLARRAVELARADRDAALRAGGRRQARHQRAAVLLDALRLLAEDALDLAQEVDERGLAVARRLREIGAAPERLAGGREEHGQRPAAVLAEMMQG